MKPPQYSPSVSSDFIDLLERASRDEVVRGEIVEDPERVARTMGLTGPEKDMLKGLSNDPYAQSSGGMRTLARMLSGYQDLNLLA